jgi:amino-acid N-acetyltransferase
MIRKAKISDAKKIQALCNQYATKGEMLPRSLAQIYENIRDFFVHEEGGEILGVCAIHVTWENLAEIRTLAVKEENKKRGIGKELVSACLTEAKLLEIQKVFTLTYKEEFFKKCGFDLIDKTELPHKVWQDCINCHKFPDCDEIAMSKTIQ